MDQKVSASLLPESPLSMPKCAQKYITSPLVSSLIFSSKTCSALVDNETCFEITKMEGKNNKSVCHILHIEEKLRTQLSS